jgi:hypothetical protein
MVGKRDFYVLQNVQNGSGAHLAPNSMDIRFFPQEKRPVREVAHSHPTIAVVEMSGAVHLLPLCLLHRQ